MGDSLSSEEKFHPTELHVCHEEHSYSQNASTSNNIDTADADELVVIPILVGRTETEELQQYSCSKSTWQSFDL